MRRLPAPVVRSLVSALAIAIASIMVIPSPSESAVIRPFGTRFTMNTTGAIVMTGNTLLTCPASASGCLAARSGSASTLAANNDNAYNMGFVDVDGDPATFNSSRNTLIIPTDATVAWAGLYWGADTTAGTGGSAAPTAAARNQIGFRTPGGAYQTITANQVDSSAVTGGVRYQGFADVTALVTEARSGEYTTANLQAGRGQDRYGGWALVVAYQDPSEPLRNLTIFDGYAVVQRTPVADQNVAIPVSGFLTPPAGPVRTRIGVVAYEGDLGLLGDSLRLNNTSLSNSLNPATNFFNSSLSGFGSTNTTGDPFQTNMLGFDIDTVQANNVLANGASSATINLNTNDDTYFPGVVSFSTELFAPQLDLFKSGVDLNGAQLDVGDEVLYTVSIANSGDDSAVNSVVTDAVPDGSTYVPGSLRINGTAVTDVAADDAGELLTGPARVVARLGTMPIGGSAEVSFRVTVGDIPDGDVLSNTATSTYTAATSRLALNGISNTVVLSPRSRSDLSLLKFTDPGPLTVPGPASFQLVARNRGPAVEPAAVVTDDLPAGFTATTAESTRGSCVISGATITCSLGSLALGDVAVIDIGGTVASGTGTITNTASVLGQNLDTNVGNNTASATLRLNNPPIAVDQTATTGADSPVVIAVLAGATDPDGDAVSTASAATPANGSVVVNSDGTVTYTPNAGFKGVDSFAFTVTDDKSGFGQALVTVTVSNAPPIAVDDSAATSPGTPLVIPVLLNDTDANSDSLTIISFTQPGGGAGSVGNNGDGTLTFTPSGSFRGTATFTYTISDGTDTATATVSIVVPDAAPVAISDFATTAWNTPVDVPVLLNDLDDNGDVLSVVAVTQPTGGAAEGVVSINSDGTVAFVPAGAFRGQASFTYTISDGTQQATAAVVVTVENGVPVAMDDAANTSPSTAVTIAVLGNDTDPNGDTLQVIGIEAPADGVASVDPAGVVTYVPANGFRGVDAFVYWISDGTDTAFATIRVTVPNTPPAAAADQASTSAGTSVSIPVLVNDFDANDDPLTVVSGSLSTPANGAVAIGPDGTVVYQPNAGFSGIDSFTYAVSDGTDTATATVTVRVLGSAPVAVDDEAATLTGTMVQIDVLANDSDPEGDPLSVLAVSAAANGEAVLDADGRISYTPSAGFVGTDTFTYDVTDGTGTSRATVTVTISAQPVPAEPPVVPVATTPVATTPVATPPLATTPVATPPIATTPVATPPTLALTGQDPAPWFAAGLRILLAGFGLLLWQRRAAQPADTPAKVRS